MRRYEFWKLGLQNVLASGLRSFLTVLGMSIGVAAILAVLTLGEAGSVQVKGEIGRLGIDQVQVTAADGGNPMQCSDSEYLRQALGTSVNELLLMECPMQAKGCRTDALLIGCDSEYLERLSPVLLKGEPFLSAEWRYGSPVALVGEALTKEWGLTVGEWFSAQGIMLRCKGIMGASQLASQMDVRQVVVVPATFLQPWLGQKVHQISVHVPEGDSPAQIAGKVETLLMEHRGIKADAVSLQVQAEAADSVLATFMNVLSWVALICMLVGGIGVTNMLLVSVRERRREIGVMQSMGATQSQICGLFLCEALIYAVTGGILGLLLGGALIAVAGRCIALVPVVKAGDCTAVFLAAVLLGLLAGVAPAASASRMKPVDALRND